MPRKAKTANRVSESTTSTETSTSDVLVDTNYNLTAANQLEMGVQAVPQGMRGAAPTRGVKKRRISSNSSAASNGIFGSGTIVASNPFDDDFPDTAANHVAASASLNNKMVGRKQSPNTMPTHYSVPYSQQVPPGQHQAAAPPSPLLHPHYHLHQQHEHSQNQMCQQGCPPQQPVGHPGDERLQRRDSRQPMTPTSCPPYNTTLSHQDPNSRPHVHNGGMMGTMAQPPPHESYTQNLETVLPTESPYASSNLVGYCRQCQREIYQGEPSIVCKASCRTYFHSACSGLTPLAYELLMRENTAEWACDNCTASEWRVPYVKYKH